MKLAIDWITMEVIYLTTSHVGYMFPTMYLPEERYTISDCNTLLKWLCMGKAPWDKQDIVWAFIRWQDRCQEQDQPTHHFPIQKWMDYGEADEPVVVTTDYLAMPEPFDFQEIEIDF